MVFFVVRIIVTSAMFTTSLAPIPLFLFGITVVLASVVGSLPRSFITGHMSLGILLLTNVIEFSFREENR